MAMPIIPFGTVYWPPVPDQNTSILFGIVDWTSIQEGCVIVEQEAPPGPSLSSGVGGEENVCQPKWNMCRMSCPICHPSWGRRKMKSKGLPASSGLSLVKATSTSSSGDIVDDLHSTSLQLMDMVIDVVIYIFLKLTLREAAVLAHLFGHSAAFRLHLCCVRQQYMKFLSDGVSGRVSSHQLNFVLAALQAAVRSQPFPLPMEQTEQLAQDSILTVWINSSGQFVEWSVEVPDGIMIRIDWTNPPGFFQAKVYNGSTCEAALSVRKMRPAQDLRWWEKVSDLGHNRDVFKVEVIWDCARHRDWAVALILALCTPFPSTVDENPRMAGAELETKDDGAKTGGLKDKRRLQVADIGAMRLQRQIILVDVVAQEAGDYVKDIAVQQWAELLMFCCDFCAVYSLREWTQNYGSIQHDSTSALVRALSRINRDGPMVAAFLDPGTIPPHRGILS
eukprot:jgi/Botrbrau1/23630/Bobra.55_2s0018.1